MRKHKTSKAWINEHVNDAFVQRAKADGWRSRAAFKLIEIDAKDGLIKPGMTVVDLGAAPGSWSQVAARKVGPHGHVLALDILAMEPIAGVEFVQGDFREEPVLVRLAELLDRHPVDLVLSDMAPNMSGIAVSDQARMMHLAELAADFCADYLRPGGSLLMKVFQGHGFKELRDLLTQTFANVQVRKPAASRGRSAETYILARNKRT